MSFAPVVMNTSSVSTYWVLRDATTGEPKPDVTVTNIDIYYVAYRTAISAKVDCTALAAADSAYNSGGAFNCGQGVYRIDFPDAAWSGASWTEVILIVIAAGCMTEARRFLRTTATRGLSGTALPDAAADAAGGLPISDAGGLAMDDLPTLAEILAGTVEGTYTVNHALRAILALFGANYTGLSAGAGNATIRDIGNTKNRAVATIDSNGNRSVASIDLS